MQQMNLFPKINGVYHKVLGGRATTESANGQDQPVQSATTAAICSTGDHSCYHLSKNQVKNTGSINPRVLKTINDKTMLLSKCAIWILKDQDL